MHVAGGEAVLLDLVGDHAVARLFDGETRQRLGLGDAAAAMASTMASIGAWESSARTAGRPGPARASAWASAIDA